MPLWSRLLGLTVGGMAYPLPFHKLVLGGTIYTENWNTGLSIQTPNDVAVSDALLTTVASAVSSWFSNGTATGAQFTSLSKLTYIKLNRVDVNGHYVDPEAQTHIYPTPIAGGGSLVGCAPQLSGVVSLRTAFDRGRASKGRMYLPPLVDYASPGTDGRVAASSAV